MSDPADLDQPSEPVVSRLKQLMTLREEVETLGSSGPWTPPADWADEDSHLALHLDVPGVNPDSLELREEGQQVTVAGERQPPARLLRSERPGGMFTRTLLFPEEVVPQTGQASLVGGVLVVRFQKKHPTIDVAAQVDVQEAE